MTSSLLKFSYAFIIFGLLFTPYQYAFSGPPISSGQFPVSLEPQLSSDGKTLFNAGPPLVYVADPNPPSERVRIAAPIDLLRLSASATATFAITYVPSAGTDPWGNVCSAFPEEAKAAFNAAAAVWSNILHSPAPITISACWTDMASSTTLGLCGGAPLKRDFHNAPRGNTWYNVSLANSLAGYDLNPSTFDMHITFNLNFTWYYGTDGNPPSSQYDLMSVALHEIGHGLNFLGTMQYSEGQGSWGASGYPNIYDTFMRDGSGNLLIDTGVYGNPSAALGNALTSNDIWFHGTNAMAANGGERVKIYAPSTWSTGSSYVHLDYTTFQGTVNRLMVFAIAAGVSTHDPGPLMRGLLKDLGWVITSGGPWVQPEVAAGGSHTVGLKYDGTVAAVGMNVDSWSDIVQVAAGGTHTVGLKTDGKVVAVGDNSDGQLNVSSWTNIVQVAAGERHTLGLQSDGKVVAVGYSGDGELDVTSWTNIVQVVAGGYHSVGLKSDGRVVAVGDNYSGQLNVDDWSHIVQVAAGEQHTVGLKSGGTVVAEGYDEFDQLNVGSWTNIVQVAAGGFHTVGLKPDGTVVAVGHNGYNQREVGSWSDIVQVAAGYIHTAGLKSNGTVVAVGDNASGQLNVGAWSLGPSFPGDFAPADCDVDGSDLAVLIANPSLLDISMFAQIFGRKPCQ
jgi:hypothetical protein